MQDDRNLHILSRLEGTLQLGLDAAQSCIGLAPVFINGVLVITSELASVLMLDACPTCDQVMGSTPMGLPHSFMDIMKYFLRSFSPFLLIQERQLSNSGERMCSILVNRLED